MTLQQYLICLWTILDMHLNNTWFALDLFSKGNIAFVAKYFKRTSHEVLPYRHWLRTYLMLFLCFHMQFVWLSTYLEWTCFTGLSKIEFKMNFTGCKTHSIFQLFFLTCIEQQGKKGGKESMKMTSFCLVLVI